MEPNIGNFTELDDNVIELVDEDGTTVKMEHVLTYEMGDGLYVAFTPIDAQDDKDDADEVVIMKLTEDDNGEEVFLPIEDEEELDSAWNTFLSVYYSEEDEEGEEEDEEEDGYDDMNDEDEEDEDEED